MKTEFDGIKEGNMQTENLITTGEIIQDFFTLYGQIVKMGGMTVRSMFDYTA
ncbi:MAG: hypothetical protein ACU833_02765 [Gammaproteobacteria bacterium]